MSYQISSSTLGDAVEIGKSLANIDTALWQICHVCDDGKAAWYWAAKVKSEARKIIKSVEMIQHQQRKERSLE